MLNTAAAPGGLVMESSRSVQMPSRDVAVQCLDDLVTADRILYGLEAEMVALRDRQVLDLLGSDSFDGLFGQGERTEVALANNRLLEAQVIIRRAIHNAGLVTDAGAIEELETLSIWDWAAEGSLLGIAFDLRGLLVHGRNQSRVRRTRLVVRSIADAVLACSPGPALHVDLPPLDPPPRLFKRLAVGWVGAEPQLWTRLHWVRAGVGVLIIMIFATLLVGSLVSSCPRMPAL